LLRGPSGRYIPKSRILIFILAAIGRRQLHASPARRFLLATTSIIVNTNVMRLRSFLAIACCVSASLCVRAVPAADPAVIRTSRVIQCECGNEKPSVVTGVTITPDGQTIAAATDDHRVLIWDAATAQLKGHLDGHADWVRSVVLSDDGNTAASGGGDRALRLWNLSEQQSLLELPDCQKTVAAVCFHPNSQQLAVAGFSNSLKIVNTSTGQISQELACPCADVRTVAFSPDGARMAVAGRNGMVRVWNVANGAQERDIATDGRPIRALAFSPDGRWLAAAGNSTTIRVLDTASGEVAMTLSTRPAKVYALLFIDNGRLATGGTDNCIWLWDLQNRQATSQLVGHTGTVAALACDAGGTTLVSGSYDTTVRIWDVAGGKAPVTASRGPGDAAR
jgi:WD40 repeat protein